MIHITCNMNDAVAKAQQAAGIFPSATSTQDCKHGMKQVLKLLEKEFGFRKISLTGRINNK